MFMHPETATVTLTADNILTVSRDSDGQLFDFVPFDKKWLLKGCTSHSNLLFGTQFVITQ